MGDAGSELREHKADWELEFARLEVNVTFAYWLWCQKRLKKLVNSYNGNSSRTWLVVFTAVRRAARNAQFAWVAALYEFRGLIEAQAKVLKTNIHQDNSENL
jgi:hypothetical protein